MSTVLRTPLPNGAGDARAVQGAGEPGLDRAWQREMEKAQTQQWFHGAPRQGSGAPAMLPTHSVVQATQVSAGPAGLAGEAAPGERVLPQARGPGQATNAAQRSSPFVIPQPLAVERPAVRAAAPQPAATVLAWRSPTPALRVTSTIADDATATRPMAETAMPLEATASPAVRVHVEETASGLRVWFGIAGEGPAVAARAQELLDQLRRECGAAGQRLARVVCNGEILFSLPPHQEP